MIYLDNSASTKPYDEVIQYMNDLAGACYGNPSSLHIMGINAEREMKKARERIAEALKCSAKDILFTSGATESNHLAILGHLKAVPRGGKHLITTAIEHPSVMEVFKSLEQEGYRVDYINVDQDGIILLDEFEGKIKEDTALVSIMHVNNETGAIQPIEKIKGMLLAKGSKAVFHVDAVQSFCKLPVYPKKMGIDLLTASSHKIHGPKGAGSIYRGESIPLKPILVGGGQENNFRSGTENVAAICGYGLAAETGMRSLEENYQQVKEIKCFMENELAVLPVVLNSTSKGSPYLLNISFLGMRSEVILHHLANEGIIVSSGSACANKKNSVSYVLKAMGKSNQEIDGAVRISFGSGNNLDETRRASQIIIKIIKELI